jgi:hypothetical protein
MSDPVSTSRPGAARPAARPAPIPAANFSHSTVAGAPGTTGSDTSSADAGSSARDAGEAGPVASPDALSTVSRDIAEVPSAEIISTAALHLMSAAAVNLGLAEDLPEHQDLDEARSLIDALAGLLDGSVHSLPPQDAAPLRDGLKSLQLAFREATPTPDEQGQGPGEKHSEPLDPR